MTVEMPLKLNQELFTKILKNLEENENVIIIDINVSRATSKGDNYTSDIYRVELTYTSNDEKNVENRSLIAKIALSSPGKHSDMVEKFDVFDTEMEIMMSTLKEMQNLLDDVKLSGECYYVEKKNPAFLIIEDLGVLGFRLADRQKGLDLQHCLLTMKGIAKFHASSVAVYEKDPEQKFKYKKGIYRMNVASEVESMLNSSLKLFSEVLKAWPEFNGMWAEKIKKLSENAYQKIAALCQPDESEFNVINHGDCWINNMLFSYDSEERPVAHTFVDFQCSVYGSPMIDLQYFLTSSPSEEVSFYHTNELIEEYHRILSETMRKLNCTTEPPTINDLNNYMEKFEVFGLVNACFALPITLQKKNESKNLEELLNESDSPINEEMYNTIEYKRAISWRLRRWHELGVLSD